MLWRTDLSEIACVTDLYKMPKNYYQFVSDYKVDLEKLEIKKTEKSAVKYTYICKISFPDNRNRKGCFLKSHTGKQISMLQIIHNNYIICFLFG